MFINNNSWLVFLGCLVFFAALILTFNRGRFGQDIIFEGLMSCILFFTWSIVAMYQQNREAGYLAIAALQFFFNFIIRKEKWTESFGFKNDKFIPSGTLSSFFLIMIGSLLHFTRVNFLTIPFTRPLLFIGTSVYFIGLLILSSRLYYKVHRNQDLFYLLQIITFLSGLASTLFGPMFDISFLLGIGGTMFVLWFLVKYLEIANWETMSSGITSLFGLGILLYVFAYFLARFFSIFHR
ncbi:unnamed protein product [Rotaria sp. Silwood1]|nr:unnamed protein product [Rotaria sp. Silwood1]CAF1182641.1 unnamed protein product [Rotaria sp. Silwood1]CAF1201675.1 unnamed protein product [Rotaria sp. Silwood1]CAF3480882.1 unnamed protein product [Rotaria sp. Silwood1]CAF5051317.1 unnamed protein product [Rotaria sp. Silwood1]